MASNPDTDPVQTADSSGQNNDSSALEVPEYSIPSWFVSDNVKTAAQPSATEPKLVFSELPNNKNCPGRQDGAFTVCRQTFLSVRDTLASCLVRDADGEFPTYNIGAILSYLEDEIDQRFPMIAEYLDALAKELGAALITLTLHDFRRWLRHSKTRRPQRPGELCSKLKRMRQQVYLVFELVQLIV